MEDKLIIKGASEHNLQNIDVDIPRQQLVVITGVSGSGKSTLAFDTIYAEGQRRYLESLSAYARQFLGLKEKPAVEQISGLSPVISIDQKSTGRNNPRSTVATVTEIYDYLRLLFARVGQPHDPAGQPITSMSPSEIIAGVSHLPTNHRLIILAPIVIDQKGEHAHIPDIYQTKGYARARIDGIIYDLDEFPQLKKQLKHSIEIVVDRVINSEANQSRISQSVTAALEIAQGPIIVVDADNKKTEHRFSRQYFNPDFPDFIPPEMEPRTFSFNSPHGACPACSGLGRRLEVDPALVIPNRTLTISEGAIRPYNRLKADAWTLRKIEQVGRKFGFDLRQPVADLSSNNLERILYGTGTTKYQVSLAHSDHTFSTTYEGVIPNLERRYQETKSDFIRREIENFMVQKDCYDCQGQRLKPAVLAVTIANKSISDVTALTVDCAEQFVNQLQLAPKASKIARPVLAEIRARLGFLREVGLNYLTLNRAANSLSGGEAQRIRLATQIGSGLQGVLYILDEPSIGLHQRDNDRLMKTLKKLRDIGNSLLVVEHDEDTIRQADYVVDIGPGAGHQGGQVTAVGTPDQIANNYASLTGDYLAQRRQIKYRPKRRQPGEAQLKIIGAKAHNLKNIDVVIPLQVMVAVSGVSGSGKSTLVNDILANELFIRLHRSQRAVGRHDDIQGLDQLDKVIIIDQSPIGRTPRSNAATYVGLYTAIRNLMASTPQARLRGFSPGHFSFNVTGGRCEACQGEGAIKKEMHFLPDIFVVCEVCQGKRYTNEVLKVSYKGHTISDILNLSVANALDLFLPLPAIKNKLQTLVDVGLGYINLGQPATTLSGGEAQRVKLAKELSKRASGRTLYILDEPTTGLHMADIDRLLDVLHTLVDAGNSMVIIEHNLDVLKNADWLIDLGPEGGEAGGRVIATGTPEMLAKNQQSITGQFLARCL